MFSQHNMLIVLIPLQTYFQNDMVVWDNKLVELVCRIGNNG